jgi:hypothetical protein
VYFGSVLCDEIDGMWHGLHSGNLRSALVGNLVDYAGYLFIFTGMAVGLYAQYGIHSVVNGALLLFGTLMIFAILIRQRKLGTDPSRPQDYRMRLHRNLEATSGNPLSLLGRIFEPLIRNGAFCYAVLIFSALNWVHAFFLALTIAANIVWIVLLSYNRFFRRPLNRLQAYPLRWRNSELSPMKIAVNGIRMNCTLEGPFTGSVVMLSHSLATDLTMWDPQFDALTRRHRLLRYDTRGHGGSDAPGGEYSLSQLAKDACGLLDALGIERVHFVGLSMGGMIGQMLALETPDRLLSLVLCDTTSRTPADARPAWDERIRIAGSAGMALLVDPDNCAVVHPQLSRTPFGYR